jgi:hypothetical protein
MKIKTKEVKKINKLFEEKKKVSFALSEQIKTAQDRNGTKEMEIERGGKKIKINEKTLWQEVYYGSAEARGIMIKKYPELFELEEKQKKIDVEINTFTMKKWGFTFNQMTLPILINLVSAIISWKIRRFFFLA